MYYPKVFRISQFYLIQSETCSLAVPELELELESGTLGGQFTTVEGILTQIKDQLSTSHPFVLGDSCEPESKMKKFIEELNEVMEHVLPVPMFIFV